MSMFDMKLMLLVIVMQPVEIAFDDFFIREMWDIFPAGDAAGDMKPMTQKFLDNGSAVEHCDIDMKM